MPEITAHSPRFDPPRPLLIPDFQAMAESGADRIEFDVLLGSGGQLFVAHDQEQLTGALLLSELLDFLSGTDLALSCDLKSFGAEFAEQVAACLEAYLPQETDLIVCSHSRHDLSVAWRRFPCFLRGWSVPQFGLPAQEVTVHPPLDPVGRSEVRASLPRIAGDAIMDGKCDLLMVELQLVSEDLLRVVHHVDGMVHAWTVRSLSDLDMLRALPVDGVITDIPREVRAILEDG